MTIISLKNAYLFPEKVGKKAFHLSLLLKQSFPVLEGYILCEPYSNEEIESLWLRVSAISPLVVRSSMEGEDGMVLSGAGKYMTKIGVSNREDFHTSIVEIMEESPLESVSRAVLVQPMFPSYLSGVMFTMCEEDYLLIEGIYGLGELLVSGQITPDSFLVHTPTSSIETRLSHQKYYGLFPVKDDIKKSTGAHLPLPAGSIRVLSQFDHQVLASIPYKMRSAPVLNSNQIEHLANLGKRVEAFLGVPQDIEWSIDQSGNVVLLQSRPITEPINVSMSLKDEPLCGLPVSKGQTTGVAVVFPCPLEEIKEDSILVTYEMQPYMIYQLPKVRAVVTETGGRLSHAAIVAREMGIPCIVGVKELTERISHGDAIFVNGDSGEVLRC